MYAKLVVPLDGSPLAEQILPAVRLLSRAYRARVVLLRSVNTAGLQALTSDQTASPAIIEAALKAEESNARLYLAEMARPFDQEGIAVGIRVDHRYPAAAILDEAEKEPDTLVAMTTRGRSGPKYWPLGSIASKVLNASTAPVLVAPPLAANGPATYDRFTDVIVPLDGSPLAEEALRHAIALHTALGLGVTLVRVTHPEGYEPVAADLDGDLPSAEAVAQQYLEETAARLREQGVPRVRIALRQGDPARRILDIAWQTPMSLVAMTTHGRSGPGRWFMGSVMDRVVRSARRPVLVIRPASALQAA